MVKLVGLTNSVGVREEYSFLQICLRIEEARKIIWVMRLVSDIGDPSRPINKHLAEALCLALEDPEASHLDRHNIEWGELLERYRQLHALAVILRETINNKPQDRRAYYLCELFCGLLGVEKPVPDLFLSLTQARSYLIPSPYFKDLGA
jgi:hypothetical protein